MSLRVVALAVLALAGCAAPANMGPQVAVEPHPALVMGPTSAPPMQAPPVAPPAAPQADAGAAPAGGAAVNGEELVAIDDDVHFNFVGPGATHHHGLDVHSFRRLWNRNHPDDAIAETGRYDGPTEIRLKKSPAGGFPIGARCGGGHHGRAASSGGSTRAHAR